MNNRPHIDGGALIRAKSQSRKAFEKLVKELREKGATDTEIIQAMIKSPLMIDRVGHRGRTP
jgi:hypothetical protein